jgi:hypothetical protein
MPGTDLVNASWSCLGGPLKIPFDVEAILITGREN